MFEIIIPNLKIKLLLLFVNTLSISVIDLFFI